eukprot:10291518-Karenia_brevis.AAC.1
MLVALWLVFNSECQRALLYPLVWRLSGSTSEYTGPVPPVVSSLGSACANCSLSTLAIYGEGTCELAAQADMDRCSCGANPSGFSQP